MRKFWWHKGRLRVAPSFRSINPFREKRNTDTRHTIFSLWGNSVWSHCLEKSVKTSFYIFFFSYKPLNYNRMQWSSVYRTTTENMPWISSDLKHNRYVKYMWSYYRWCKQWIPCVREGGTEHTIFKYNSFSHRCTYTLFPHLSESQRGLWEW